MITEEEIDILVKLKKLLLNTPWAKENTTHTHVMIRCPICGDSLKHQDSTHCYVNIEGGKPLSYYCFKCSEGHWVNSNFLKSLGITSPEILSEVWGYNKRFMNATAIHESKYIIYGNKQCTIPIYDKPTYLNKIRYIENRLGIRLDNQICKELKIILSLKDFLDVNGFNLNTSEFVFKTLEKSYVGFLSADSSYIIFRKITQDKFRYMNYPVFTNSGNWGSKIYIIPGKYDIMENDIECNITEGIFDIISCYFNINNCNRKNKIYVSVNGSGFRSVIKKILNIGFIGNLNINIYSDSDKSIEYYNNLKDVKDFCKSIKLFYNQYPNEKDIGVPKERIEICEAKMTL